MCGENERKSVTRFQHVGTSPRVWGKRAQEVLIPILVRNIPTCVGKTPRRSYRRSSRTEHPHVCGENSVRHSFSSSPFGTSPRVWGKPPVALALGRRSRNIPTCVGKTLKSRSVLMLMLEHPHVCGENCIVLSLIIEKVGTSPRVWGKQLSLILPMSPRRNIPTCVGKTQ